MMNLLYGCIKGKHIFSKLKAIQAAHEFDLPRPEMTIWGILIHLSPLKAYGFSAHDYEILKLRRALSRMFTQFYPLKAYE